MNPLIPAILSTVLSATQTGEAPVGPPNGLVRPLPADAVQATMSPPELNAAQFDSKRLNLAPGVQIRDAQNRIVLPMNLTQPVLVRYQVDGGGDVRRVWILSEAEAAATGVQMAE